MARPTIKIWTYVGVGSALAAAAAVLIMVSLNLTALTGPDVAARPPAPPQANPNVVVNSNPGVAPSESDLEKVSVVPVVQVVDEKIISGGKNQPPLRQITQDKFEKTTWVDKHNNIHIETTGAPHREVILIQVETK